MSFDVLSIVWEDKAACKIPRLATAPTVAGRLLRALLSILELVPTAAQTSSLVLNQGCDEVLAAA